MATIEVEQEFNQYELIGACECHEGYVDILEQEIEWMKRNLWVLSQICICMKCEQSWEVRKWLTCKTSEYKLLTKYVEEEE